MGLVLSVWFNLCASKLQYHSRLAKDIRSSVAEFVVRHEEQVRRQSIIKFREDIAAVADLEAAGGMVCEEKKDAENDNDVVDVQSQPKVIDDDGPAGDADDDQQNRLVEVGKLIFQVTTQEREIPSPHEKTTTIIAAFWLVILSLAAFLPFSARQRELFIGIVVNCNLVFFYAAPLSTIAKVLKTKSSASIHIPSMVTATFNGIFWGGFGIATKDLVIAVPNTMGAGLGFVQVALCFLFPRKEAAE
jgi:solute carrier family 50 protein (sugar transporter)